MFKDKTLNLCLYKVKYIERVKEQIIYVHKDIVIGIF